MEKEDIVLLAQLMHAMREIAERLEDSFEKKDFEGVRQAKRELGRLQNKIGELL